MLSSGLKDPAAVFTSIKFSISPVHISTWMSHRHTQLKGSPVEFLLPYQPLPPVPPKMNLLPQSLVRTSTPPGSQLFKPEVWQELFILSFSLSSTSNQLWFLSIVPTGIIYSLFLTPFVKIIITFCLPLSLLACLSAGKSFECWPYHVISHIWNPASITVLWVKSRLPKEL